MVTKSCNCKRKGIGKFGDGEKVVDTGNKKDPVFPVKHKPKHTRKIRQKMAEKDNSISEIDERIRELRKQDRIFLDKVESHRKNPSLPEPDWRDCQVQTIRMFEDLKKQVLRQKNKIMRRFPNKDLTDQYAPSPKNKEEFMRYMERGQGERTIRNVQKLRDHTLAWYTRKS